MLATSDVQINHKALAEYMGPECTVEAIRNKLRKLKAAEKNEDVSATATAIAIPAAKEKEGKTPKSTGKRKKTTDGEVSRDRDMGGTPSKAAKRSMLDAGAAAAAGGDQGEPNDGNKETEMT